ncbi:MAG: helix-turn-helix domain-containing protein [Planctomycetota bacterium]|nr:helix-turn-helix domain-containing protein [Planctomycetota bacterium]
MSRKRPHEPGWRFSRRDLNRCGADGKRLYLTAEDAAAYFGVSLHTVLQWCRLGAVPEHRIGGRIYLNREEVLKYWEMFQKKR